MKFRVSVPIVAGACFLAAPLSADPLPGMVAFEGYSFGVRVGDVLAEGGAPLFRIRSIASVSCAGIFRDALVLEALCDIDAGEHVCVRTRTGYALAWVTLSDKGSVGKRHDESGPLIGELVAEKLELNLVAGMVLPDEEPLLRTTLTDLALRQGFDLILTTGGTGVAPRDVTPEATLRVIEKRLPGYERAMTAASLAKTPHGAISRAVAGIIGRAIVVNMPGSPKAVRECLEPLLPTFRHTLEKLHGDQSDCATL